jgi:hypothetical protein
MVTKQHLQADLWPNEQGLLWPERAGEREHKFDNVLPELVVNSEAGELYGVEGLGSFDEF